MNFFKYFPTVDYTFQNSNGAYALNITNTTVHVKLAERIKKNISVFYDYQVQDGERPDTVSVNLYGTVEFTWVILLVNKIFTLFDWPLTTDEFNNYIIERYDSLAAAQALLLYKTVDGYFVDEITWNALDVDERMEPITVYDNELDLNENKRRIQVVPAEFVTPLSIELKKILAS